MDFLSSAACLTIATSTWWLFSLSFTWLLLALLFVLACYTWTNLLHQPDPSCDLPLPPGSMGFPLIGETIQFLYAIIRQGNFHDYRIRKYGNVFKTHLLGNPTIRVRGVEGVSKILSNRNNEFILEYPPSVRILIGETSGATMTNGDLHKLYRRLYLKSFTSQALSRHVGKISQVIQHHIKEWLSAGDVTVFPLAHRVSFSVSYHCLLGLPHNERALTRMEQDFNTFLAGLQSPPYNIPGSRFSKALRAKSELQQDIYSLYQGNAANLDMNSTLRLMLETSKEQEISLTLQNVLDLATEMAFAGHVTNASAITSIVMALGKNPDVLDKLRKEFESMGLVMSEGVPQIDFETLIKFPYLDNVIREILFLYPPAGGGFRRAVKTVRIQNYQVPKGWMVIYDIRGTHALAPSTFNPSRWESGEMPPSDRFNFTFSAGSRPCAGKDFALLVLKCFTVNLVLTCDWQLQNPDVRIIPLPVTHPEDNLPIRIKSRCQ